MQQTTIQRCMLPSRQPTLACEARHPKAHHTKVHHARHAPGKNNAIKKKRDISTSFRKGCIPRPLQNTANTAHEEDQHPIIGIPPPAQTAVPAAAQSLLNQAAASTTGLSLGEACRAGARASTEPVIAAAAAAAAAVAAPVLTSQDLGLSLDDDPASVISSGSDDSADGLWAEDPLASFDRVLDGLLLAPALAQTYSAPSTLSTSTSSSSGGSSQDLISLLDELQLHQGASTSSSAAGSKAKKASRVSTATQSVPSSWRSSSSKSKSMPAGAAAAAAGPAVTVVHCETEYERELAAAAALQQLLVVKVESSHHLLQGALDRSLRFQTHSSLPPHRSAYMSHSDFSFLGSGAAGAGSSSNSPNSSTVDVLASMGINLGMPASSNSSSAHGMGSPSSSLFAGSGSGSTSGELFSPVHAWYKQLAAQYAHSAAAAGRTCPVRFVALQCDPAHAVARRLGVSSPLAVVLVDPASGRKLQEVCGTKIEQELPNGLLYFAGSDPQGVRPAEQLAQANTVADLEAAKSASQLAVMAFHIHAAPPCVRSYARMHSVAQQYVDGTAPRVSFGVMDVDLAADGAEVSSALGLQQFPTYIIYQDGQEVARLSSSPERRRLGEVLAELAAASKQEMC